MIVLASVSEVIGVLTPDLDINIDCKAVCLCDCH